MDGGAWWATVHRVAKSRTRLSNVTVSLSVLPSQQRDVLELLTFPGDAVVESACQLRRHKRLDT